MNTNGLRCGDIIRYNKKNCIVKTLEIRNPSSRGAQTLYKVRLAEIPGNRKHDVTLTGSDTVEEVDMLKRSVSFLYQEGEMYTFMDAESYDQYLLHRNILEDHLPYLTENLEGITLLIADDQALTITLPKTVTLIIEETPPAIKGASASARTKTARLNTGLEVQVPEYLENHTEIRVNTETGKFLNRA